jgi:hypothetical protein
MMVHACSCDLEGFLRFRREIVEILASLNFSYHSHSRGDEKIHDFTAYNEYKEQFP